MSVFLHEMKAGHLYQLWDIDGNKFGARTIGNIKHLDLLVFLKSVGVAYWEFECFLVLTHLGICMMTCRHQKGPKFEEIA